MNILAKIILSELGNISFFLKYADIFEFFLARTKRELLSFPVEWDQDYVKVRETPTGTDDAVSRSYGEVPSWREIKTKSDLTPKDFYVPKYEPTKQRIANIEIKGKLTSGQSITLRIHGDYQRYSYILKIDNKVFPVVHKLEEAKKLVENYSKGKDIDIHDRIYKKLLESKNKIFNSFKNILEFVSLPAGKSWKILFNKDKSNKIFIRAYVENLSKEEHDSLVKKIKEKEESIFNSFKQVLEENSGEPLNENFKVAISLLDPKEPNKIGLVAYLKPII